MHRRIAASCLSLLGLACIERPEQSHVRPVPTFDRSAVADVLVTGPVAPRHLVAATFDPIELVGYDVTPDPPTRGQPARVTVYYRAAEDVTEDWQIFIHMEDQAKVVQRFNVDHWPARGRLHTNQWRKGDIIRDDYTFTYPATVNALELWTGFYQGEERLPLTSAGRGISDGVNRLRAGVIVAQ